MINVKYSQDKYVHQWLTLFNSVGGGLDKFSIDIIKDLYSNGSMTKEDLKCSGKIFVRGRWDSLMDLVKRGIVKERLDGSVFIYTLSMEIKKSLDSKKFEVSWQVEL